MNRTAPKSGGGGAEDKVTAKKEIEALVEIPNRMIAKCTERFRSRWWHIQSTPGDRSKGVGRRTRENTRAVATSAAGRDRNSRAGRKEKQ